MKANDLAIETRDWLNTTEKEWKVDAPGLLWTGESGKLEKH